MNEDLKWTNYDFTKILFDDFVSNIIFENRYFREIEKTWKIKSIAQGRNRKCAITCGMKNLVTSQKFDCR